MNQNIPIAPFEKIENRSFTDLNHSLEDFKRLVTMTHQLVETYEDPLVCDFSKVKGAVCQSDPRGRHFRIYYIQPEKLFSLKNLSVVGFFGKRRPHADIKPLINADKAFEKMFYDFEGLLSLSTVRLSNGDFGNLVLFTDDDAKDQWNYSPAHFDTVSKISPPYYANIRLNNGILPNGVDIPDSLNLTKVRYLDYSETPPWQAVRKIKMLR